MRDCLDLLNFMSKGQKLLELITSSKLFRIEREGEHHIIVWSSGAAEQLDAFVAEITKPSLTMRILTLTRQQRDAAEKALRQIIKEPFGCRFCDSGKLRTPNNPDKDHDVDCGYLMAQSYIAGMDALKRRHTNE